jgi:hypothetical protein
MLLYCLQASEAPTAVIFRRGPSKKVLLIKWDTENDTFEEGQWLKGRIYERRCDLSPNGKLLVYFAATWKQPYQSWTAVSRPPYFTALALWPKGDAWGGGGLFKSDRHLELNHWSSQMEMAEEFRLAKWFSVSQHPIGGRGEDEPIWLARLQRDGWRVVMSEPTVWEKPNPIFSDRWVLRMIINGVTMGNGRDPWWDIDHEVIDQRMREITRMPQTSWADWSASGDLLYAKEGKLFRSRQLARSQMIADFSDRAFRNLEAPHAATIWGPKTK